MSDHIPATNIGELDIHLRHVMDKITGIEGSVAHVQRSLALLATTDYVDEQVRGINQRIEDSKASNQIGKLAKFLGSLLVVGTFLGAVWSVTSDMKETAAVIKAMKKP